jgi:hypothetical protein
MNWSAIAAVAEVIGVIGLIISIAYLGLQAHQGNRVAQDSAFQGVFSMTIDHIRGMVDGDNRDVIIKGLIDYNNLLGSEKITFDHLMIGLMTTIESAILSNDMGLLDDEQPDGFGHYLRTRILPYSGTQAWWTDTKDMFSPTVQNWVVSQIAKTDMESDFFCIKKSASN